ncbi:MAG: MFS transporter [Flavobacteriales bacterium]|nr:MFS transporter [Flavobacteriales bacterium]
MEKIQNQKHTKETLYYSISRMFERASYYGFRAIVVLYMIGETLKMETNEAISIYGWFTASILLSQIVGALLGDLLIGNKKSIIIGGVIQAMGAFTLCIPSTTGLYLGLFLVVLGSGFFSPNIISNFGKLYLDKTKLLDSGFTLFYLAINLGSFWGIVLIGYLGEQYGYNWGFSISGILMLISIIPILLSKEKRWDKVEKNEFTLSKKVLNISIAFIVVALFWGFNELSGIRKYDLQIQLSEISPTIPHYLWELSQSIFTLSISVILIILWTYFYSNQFVKLMLGFIWGALAFGMILLIPEVPTEQHVLPFFISLLLLAISEIHIAPIIHSVLTKYSNPKYLAILISLTFLPIRSILFIFSFYDNLFYGKPFFGLKIGIVGMSIVGIGLILYLIIQKKMRQKHL